MELQQKITNEQLFAKLCDVEKLLNTQKIEKGLWEIQDIADYCGFSYHHTYSYIISDPRFPASIDISGKGGSRTKRLYLKKDVIEFFAKHKQKKVI